MKRLFSLSILFLVAFFQADCQPRLGLPRVINYTKDDYKGAIQNWDIESDERGKLYFGNHYGMIEFDGSNWNLAVQPTNRTTVRALCKDVDHRIYLGASNDIGYMITNALGQIGFQSLTELVSSENKNFGDVWNVLNLENRIIFVTKQLILIYNGERVEEISVDGQIDFSTVADARLIIKIRNKGLFYLDGKQLSDLPNASFLAEYNVRSLLKSDAGYIICTEKKGLFVYDKVKISPWKTPLNERLQKVNINTAIRLKNGNYAFGTIKHGLFVSDSEGRFLLHLDRSTGLQHNSVISIYEDDINNLWLALDNGISYVELGSDFYYLDERSGLEGAVYGIQFFNDKLYAGSNQGLYFITENTNTFQFVEGSEGHIWDLGAFGDQLLAGCHLGTFSVKERSLVPVNTLENGTFTFLHPPGREDLLIQGGYTGMYLLQETDKGWGNPHKISDFDLVARELLFDKDGYLWVSHGYNGAYRLKLNEAFDKVEEVQLYDNQNGLPSNLFTNLFRIDDELLFGTIGGVYCYIPEADTIVPHKKYQEILGAELIRRLVKMPDGSVFFIAGYDNEDEGGIISYDDHGNVSIQSVPFQKLNGELIPAFEKIVFHNEKDILFGGKDGIIVYSGSAITRKPVYYTNINEVALTRSGDSIIYGQQQIYDHGVPSEFVQKLPFQQNALRIDYSASFYDSPENVRFQSLLDGYDEDWTVWSDSRNREFTNLREGSYRFHVRAMNIYGEVSEEDQFSFVIQPPWYRSQWMYGVYLFMAGIMFFGLVRIKNVQIKRLERKQALVLERQETEHIKKNLEAERKLHLLESEKLMTEIDHKSKELASSTMNLMKLNQTVLGIKEQVETIDVNDPEILKEKLWRISKTVNEILENDQNWEHFEMLFNQIHDNFIQRLKTEYPDLTTRDIRLCAYLRMNLNSKEIAPLMGISYRAIEALRYRVRKKMLLENHDNLTEHILNF